MKKWGTRHTFILMSFFMMVLNQCWRINLSVAIVAMVDQGSTSDAESRIGSECPILEEPTNSTVKRGDFDWNAQQQGVVLGAFFYGFIISMIPGGYLSERYSSKWVIFWAALGASLCSILSPIAAKYGDYAGFVAIKVVQGLVQAPLIPGSITIISSWIPPVERSFGTSMIFGGQGLGSVLSFALSGYLADNFGWEWDFYSFGILGLVFCFFWALLVYNKPSDHPRISTEEKEFIEDGIGILKTNEKLPLPPYRQILTSVPFWALSVTFVCSAWGFYTLLTNVPTYLNNIQHIPLTLNGLVTSIPYLLNWIISLPIGFIADYLIGTGKMSLSKVRKMMTLIAMLNPAIGLLSLTFIGCNPYGAVALLCFGAMLYGAVLSGFNVNQLELSPNYAGTLRGITSTIGNICGFATPALVGYLTDGNQTIEAWNKVFIISAVMYVIGALAFVIFGSTSVQPWNTYWKTDADEEMLEKTPLLKTSKYEMS